MKNGCQRKECKVTTWTCHVHGYSENCHLQNWVQKLSLAEMVTVRDHFSFNKEIERMSKDQSSGKILLVLLVYVNGETWQCIVSMNCTVYSLFQFSYLHAFYKPNYNKA